MAKSRRKKQPAKKKAAKKRAAKRPTKKPPTGEPAGEETASEAPPEVEVEFKRLDELQLDPANPRLGGCETSGQSEILDVIVERHGIDDVLSSIAVNGYFASEPVVGRRSGNKIVVVEGNRRLAACLILSGDPRAKGHEKRSRRYRRLLEHHSRQPPARIPVIVRDSMREILAYLGVRHIAAIKPWDSYAKALWVSQVMERSNGGLTIEEVSEMIGDESSTVARIVEGYRVVRQLEEKNLFMPSQSMRGGRGSNVDFPFSWVYTALGYNAIRAYLGLESLDKSAKKAQPLSRAKLTNGSELMTMLFGNAHEDIQPKINDSRKIGTLASLIGERRSRDRLKRGDTVDEVADLMLPASERVGRALSGAERELERAIKPVAADELSRSDAQDLLPDARRVLSLASNVRTGLRGLAGEDDE